MSVINTETDRKNKTVTYATGVVDFVKLDKFDEPKTFVWDGKAIVSTHRASIALKPKGAGKDEKGVWIGLGDIELKEGYENLQVKDGDNWVTIEKGVEVSIDIDKVDQKGDKTFYNTKKSRITVLSTEGVQAKAGNQNTGAQKGQGASYNKKRDTVGIETGHAVNGALELIRGGVKGDAFELAGLVQSATVTLKAEVAKERGVEVTDYDLGASVGHAILNACRDHSGEEVTVDEVIEGARVVLELADKVSAAIRGNTPVEPKAEKPKTTKPKDKVEKPKVSEPPMDFDDDIPFAPIGLQHGISLLHAIA